MKLSEKMLLARLTMTGYVAGLYERTRRDERGQGSVEYVGIIIVVVAIVGLIAAAAATSGIGQTVMTRISTEIQNL